MRGVLLQVHLCVKIHIQIEIHYKVLVFVMYHKMHGGW